MQRVDKYGVSQWGPNGEPVCTAAAQQFSPELTSDGSGGAIIAWQDYRSGSSWDIYTQRIDASGVFQWSPNGEAICSGFNGGIPGIVSDGSGGAVIAWHDARNGNLDIYAQRVNSSGVIQWTPNGEPISTAKHNQMHPQLASGIPGQALITWRDHRNGNWDIYAQRVPLDALVSNIVIDGLDTDVENFPYNASLMSSLIEDLGAPARNHKGHVNCVSTLEKEAMEAGCIIGKDKNILREEAARADIP